jgi:hypothetical protein
MITVLKGSPQYSIDNNGLMSISTVWMLLPDETNNSIVGWYEFENAVAEWAGTVGDKYKMPKQSDGKRDIFEFKATDAFIVTDVQYACVEGRTHYEVSYTCEQNIKTMRMEGNVSVQIDNSNEKTKSVTYLLNVESGNPLAIDSHFLESGTQVSWAGTDYRISETSYEPQSASRYSISITAKDMSVMKIGNTQFTTESLGQKTASAVWKYSTEAYNDWLQPAEGEDASAFLGLPQNSGYIISSISAEPDGVLGYRVTVNATHVSKRHVTTSYREYVQNNSTYKSSTIQYQSDRDSLPDFSGRVSDYASEFGRDDEIVTEVSVEESGRNNYNVSISTTDNPNESSGGSNGHNSDDMESVGISMNMSEMALDAHQCGYFAGLSGEYYPINNPPKTKFTYTTTPDALINQSADAGVHGYNVTAQQLLSSIKDGTMIGYDRIVGVQAETDDTLVWLTPKQIAALTSLDSVQSIKMEGFVYAQPSMTIGDTILRSLIFVPWEHEKCCPVTSSEWKQEDGRDVPLDKKFINYKLRFCEFSVDKAYKGNITTTLRNKFDIYFHNAIEHIHSPMFTSYKGVSVAMTEVKDSSSKIWTRVTCGIQALLTYNDGQFVWNSKYDNTYVEVHTQQ